MSRQRYVVELLGLDRGPETIYEKDGGGLTRDIQEAKLVGWTKRAQKRWADPRHYALHPVIIKAV